MSVDSKRKRHLFLSEKAEGPRFELKFGGFIVDVCFVLFVRLGFIISKVWCP